MSFDERYAKHGKAWRYVLLLEHELNARKTRRKTLLTSLGLNVVLLLYILWGAFA